MGEGSSLKNKSNINQSREKAGSSRLRLFCLANGNRQKDNFHNSISCLTKDAFDCHIWPEGR